MLADDLPNPVLVIHDEHLVRVLGHGFNIRTSSDGRHASKAPLVAAANALIIDDNAIVRRTIVNLVAELGFAATGVPSIEAARTLLGRDVFDIVLCDEHLGVGQTGTEFLSTDQAALPVTLILMSGEPRPTGLPAYVDYLAKPFTITQLEQALTPGA
jgi:DNA-binding NtrC family response regulator